MYQGQLPYLNPSCLWNFQNVLSPIPRNCKIINPHPLLDFPFFFVKPFGKYAQLGLFYAKLFQMTVLPFSTTGYRGKKKLNKTSIDRSGMCLCWFAEENQQNVGCKSQGLNIYCPWNIHLVIVRSLQYMILRLTTPFLKLVGLGVIANPESSNSTWQNWKYTQSQSLLHTHTFMTRCHFNVLYQFGCNVTLMYIIMTS